MSHRGRENYLCENELIIDFGGQKMKPNTTEFHSCNGQHLRKQRKIKAKNSCKINLKTRSREIYSPRVEIWRRCKRKMKVVNQKWPSRTRGQNCFLMWKICHHNEKPSATSLFPKGQNLVADGQTSKMPSTTSGAGQIETNLGKQKRGCFDSEMIWQVEYEYEYAIKMYGSMERRFNHLMWERTCHVPMQKSHKPTHWLCWSR